MRLHIGLALLLDFRLTKTQVDKFSTFLTVREHRYRYLALTSTVENSLHDHYMASDRSNEVRADAYGSVVGNRRPAEGGGAALCWQGSSCPCLVVE